MQHHADAPCVGRDAREILNMSGLLDSVLGQLDGGRISQLAGAIGADASSAEKAVASALPALVGGLAANASNPTGAAALDGVLGQLLGRK